jgi:hypothetical protein
MALPRSFVGFNADAPLARYDVLQDLVDGAPRADQRQDMTVYAAASVTIVVAFFGRPPFPSVTPAFKSLR